MWRSFAGIFGGRTSAKAMGTISMTTTISGCYYSGGQSRATVSVEVAWAGLANGDDITVTLPGALNGTTRTITQNDSANPPIVTPQVVSFEIPATLNDTVSASEPGGGSDSDPVVSSSSCAPLTCGANDLGGMVFADYNADGIRQGGEINGAANVTVTAYDVNGATYTTTTNSAGRYCLTIPPANYPVRVEFTNIPAEFSGGYSAQQGVDSRSTVQFVSAPDTTVDLGVNNPIDYCQTDPNVMTPCYVFGDPLATTGTPANDAGPLAAIVRFSYSLDGVETGEEMFATAAEIGTIWALAYKKQTSHLFAAATVRRHSGLGPAGLGGIYVLNPKGPAGTGNVIDSWSVETQLGINVQDPMAPLGGSTNPATSNIGRGLSADKSSPSHDPDAFSAVGTLGIGDIDVTEDGSRLFFVNQYDKTLYGVDISGYDPTNTATRPTNTSIVVSTVVPNPGCVNGEWRPSGTKVRRGVVYVGGVCNAITSGMLSDLRASVQAYNITAGTWTEIFNFPLTYPKGSPLGTGGEKGWHPWTDSFSVIDAGSNTSDTAISYSVPMFTDIEFDVDGTMVLGFNDRTGMQTGRENYSTNTGSTTTYTGFTGGDTLRAFFSSGTFVLENNAKAGPATGYAPNNNEGPGFGEFYNDNWRTTGHTETTVGGLAIRPGSGEVAVSSMDPHDSSIWAAGVRYISNSTGLLTHAFAVYSDSNDVPSTEVGKSTGVGDLELTCDVINVLEIGNRVWYDQDGDGVQDPDEIGLNNITVNLYRNNVQVGTTTTDTQGQYAFNSANVTMNGATGLLPNTSYEIRVPQAQMNALGYSAATQADGDATTGGDTRDSDATMSGGNGVIAVLTGNYGEINHTFDMGWLRGASIGNQIFYDTNNNGVRDAGEAGINGVTVEIYRDDSPMDGAPDSAFPIARTTTATGTLLTSNGVAGMYLFAQQTLDPSTGSALGTPMDLVPGKYIVCLPASNFNAGQPLAGLYSSGTTAGADASLSESGSPDPNTGGQGSPANPGIDNDDNGSRVAAGAFLGAVCSQPVDIGTNEPLGESPDNDPNAPTVNSIDGSENLTVDFGFYSLSIGNLIFSDSGPGAAYNNGVYDPGDGEQPLAGVTVRLYAENGTTLLSTKLTAANGKYLFPALAAGKYYVEVDRTSGPLVGSVSSLDTGNAGSPNAADNDDNGVNSTQTATVVRSPQLMLMPGDSTATGESDQAASITPGFGNPAMADNAATADANSNLEVDFGFVPYWTLGNRVWKDLNNSGTIDGADGGSPGVNGVKVVLLDGNGDPARDIYGNLIANALTQNGGYYRFDLLPPGNYIVELPADNFLQGKALYNHNSSSGTPASVTGPYENPAPDPDNPPANGGIDSDDNGDRQAGGAVRSQAITLGPWGTGEFLNETDRESPNPAAEAPDSRANLTLDFGFVPGMSLGNIVWKDLNDDGIRQNGEPFMPNVVLELYADTNNSNTLDVGAGDTLLGMSTTTLAGEYGFIGLIPGGYFVRVTPSNFTGGGALVGCLSSSVDDATPNNNDDDDDNGINNGVPATNGVASGLITLAVGTEPDGTLAVDGDTDANTNLTIDFGFASTSLSLGNLVWKDVNNDGLRQGGELGVGGVLLRLYKDANGNNLYDSGVDLEVAGASPQTTDLNGYYLFTGLLPGAYFVQIDAANFLGAGPLNGCISSTPTDGTPDNNDDNDDNGRNDTPTVISNFITLTANGEPDVNADGDNANSNQTVDFGFYAPLALGNLIWKDFNNNGVYEPGAGETGVNGVQVELYLEANATPGLQIPGDAFVTSQATAGGGIYSFAGLLPGNYYVFLHPDNFTSGALAGCISSTMTQTDPNLPANIGGVDNDDNGFAGPNGGVTSGMVTLTGNAEPTGEDANPNTNLTVDFGFYSTVNLGNLVWKDHNNNGLYEPANGEVGVDGVVVELFRDNNNGVFDPATDTSLGTQTTINGVYNFTGLLPGGYFVRVNTANFQSGGKLAGCLSSTTTAASPNNDTDNDDNGIDDQGPPLSGIASGLVTLAGSGEPDTAVDGDGTNGNLTVDFGFYPQLNLGNLVWKDYDNDGVKDAGEPAVPGVRLDLYRDNGDHAFNQATDTLTAQRVTDNNGNYNFTGLIPGDYFVRVSAVNFAANGVLYGCLSSTPASLDPDLPANPGGTDNDDNGINNGDPAANGVVSGEVTLFGLTEPDTAVDGDGTNGNLTVDFGFHPPLNLGNRVWKDVNDNGLIDMTEVGVDGVSVQLYSDNGGSAGVYDAGDTAVGSPVTTSGGGYYNFAGLTPGAYIVRLLPANFQGGGALAGCYSSTLTDSTPDNNDDSDDNGVNSATPQADGISSNAVNLNGNDEPDTVVDGDGKNGNLTMDFGFYTPVSLGNQVWKDYDNDGVRDAGEPGIGNVTVELWRETNGTPGLQMTGGTPDTKPVNDVTTNGAGLYQFANLVPDDYYVRIPAAEFQGGGDLAGCVSSTVEVSTPNGNTDNDDNGLNNGDPAVNGVASNASTLISGQEPDTVIDGDGPNGNNTVDFGFYAPVNLGNVVWKDNDNDGVYEPSAGETGVDNVTVEIYRDNGDGVYGAGDTFVTSATTAGGGIYNFPNLTPGGYLVRIPAAEFQAGGDLAGCLSSVPTDGTPNNDEDNDDNGVDDPAPQTNGIATPAVTLLGNSEPSGDGDGVNGNLTLDLGFIPQMTLGNRVWKDLNNDGLLNNGEAGVDGVLVELYRDNGNNAFDPNTDAKVAETTTATVLGVTGTYSFSGLAPATYFVRVAPVNFGQNAVLAGCVSSTGADAGDATDDNDNGVDGGTPQAVGIPSNAITLLGNSEPTSDGDGPNGNLTVDFGLYAPVNLGNRVWKDHNNDGLLNNGEPGVDGVTVQLYRDNGDNTPNPANDTLITSQTTSGGGYYNFANLTPGNYFARIPAAEFQAGGDLVGCLSSEPTVADPNQAAGGTDHDDNGLNDNAPQTNGIRSNLVDLQGNAEPTNDGDGANGNLTVDFGFIPQMTLGNLIWKDVNNDGQYQAGEAGVGGVTLNLYRETNGTPGLQTTGGTPDALAGTTTSASSGVVGSYQFTGLAPAIYYVTIPAAEFQPGGDLAGCLSSEPTDLTPDNNDDGDDNGVNSPTPETTGIQTNAITLVGNSEPTTDGDGPNGNNTVDLGFIPQMNLGNLVWKDNNNDGLVTSGEPAVDNVTVELIRDVNGNNQPDDAVYRTTSTAGGGVYNFANLPPANYFVRIPAAEFQAGGDLAGCLSSTTTEANPNLDVDNNDNGADSATPQTGGITTGLVALIGNSEPATDGDGPNGNLTIDLGFYPPMNLGNLVWKDLDNNGLKDSGEPGIQNVTVELYRDSNNNNVFDMSQPLDALVMTTTTDGNGAYSFANLLPGTYFLRIAPAEFQAGGDLAGCVSSTTNVANANSDIDSDDNGADNPTPTTNGIVAGPCYLIGNSEPPVNVDTDGPNGNLTVDFGFYAPLSLGNLVWKDTNNNGLKDSGEPGVANVAVELFRDSNNNQTFDPATDSQVFPNAKTDLNGNYRFDNLVPGAYFVRIAQANFTGQGALDGCLSSTTTVADPNLPVNVGGADNDDNGVDNANPALNGIVTNVINLTGGAEPAA
ncbi:MAG: SdrD B-like domain-containing protein, partial [Blastocatellia bacterium]